MAQSQPFLGGLEPFYGRYIQVVCQAKKTELNEIEKY
jgi:hypothetical protein